MIRKIQKEEVNKKGEMGKKPFIFLPISVGFAIAAIVFAVKGLSSPSPELFGGATLLTLIIWNRIDMRDIRKDVKDILGRLDRRGIK